MNKVTTIEYDGTNRLTLTADELAKQLGVGRKAAQRIGIEAGALVKVGKLNRYSIEKVKRYINGSEG